MIFLDDGRILQIEQSSLMGNNTVGLVHRGTLHRENDDRRTTFPALLQLVMWFDRGWNHCRKLTFSVWILGNGLSCWLNMLWNLLLQSRKRPYGAGRVLKSIFVSSHCLPYHGDSGCFITPVQQWRVGTLWVVNFFLLRPYLCNSRIRFFSFHERKVE